MRHLTASERARERNRGYSTMENSIYRMCTLHTLRFSIEIVIITKEHTQNSDKYKRIFT